MPMKNAFDFVERPDNDQIEEGGAGSGASKSKGSAAQLKKIMEGLKRKNRTTFVNKRMAIVKLDY
jgi:hypothetical protein